MNSAEHVRASTEPGPLGLLLWVCTAVLAIMCSIYALPWLALVPLGCAVIVCAFGIARMASLCDPDNQCTDCMVGQGRQCKCREALSTDIEPWNLPHMNNQPNDGGA